MCTLSSLHKIITFKCWSIRAYVRHLNLRSAWSGRFSCPLWITQNRKVCQWWAIKSWTAFSNLRVHPTSFKIQMVTKVIHNVQNNLWEIGLVTDHEINHAREVLPQKIRCSSNKSWLEFFKLYALVFHLHVHYSKSELRSKACERESRKLQQFKWKVVSHVSNFLYQPNETNFKATR